MLDFINPAQSSLTIITNRWSIREDILYHGRILGRISSNYGQRSWEFDNSIVVRILWALLLKASELMSRSCPINPLIQPSQPFIFAFLSFFSSSQALLPPYFSNKKKWVAKSLSVAFRILIIMCVQLANIPLYMSHHLASTLICRISHLNKAFWQQFQCYAPLSLHIIRVT